MNLLKRRKLLTGGFALLSSGIILGCNAKHAEYAGNDILTEAEESLEMLFEVAPESRDIYNKSAGTLVMPRVTKASFVFGGAYGEGVLKIGGAHVDFYSVAAASFGYQLGAIQYRHVIFFMTEDALRTFRLTDGWEIGADAEVFFRKRGVSVGVTNNTLTKPIYAIVFGQRGVIAGASLEGAKYSRLIR